MYDELLPNALALGWGDTGLLFSISLVVKVCTILFDMCEMQWVVYTVHVTILLQCCFVSSTSPYT